MSLRGTIIKVPDHGPGLLFVDGQQKSFLLAGIWRSPVAPGPKMVVDVDLDSAGSVVGITTIDPQQLAKEKLDQFRAAAQERGKQAAVLARQGIRVLAARMGRVALVTTLLLWIAWFFLPVLSVNLRLLGLPLSKAFTFWELLGVYLTPGSIPTSFNAAGGLPSSHGFGSFLGLLALAAPLVSPFLRDPRAKFLAAAPLSYLGAFYLKLLWDIHGVADTAHAAAKADPALSGIVGDLAKQVLQTVSYEYGCFLLVGASVVLAAQACRHR